MKNLFSSLASLEKSGLTREVFRLSQASTDPRIVQAHRQLCTYFQTTFQIARIQKT